MIPKVTGPYFLLHRARLLETYELFSQLGEVYYPVKANSNQHLLRELTRLGSAFDVETHTDVRRLLNMGVAPSKMQFSVALKTSDEVRRVRQDGVSSFVVDSEHDYTRLRELGPGTCLLRLSLEDLIDQVETRQLKWGMRIEEALRLIMARPQDHASRIGVSFYLSKRQYSPDHFHEALRRIGERFATSGITILDIGGGLDDCTSPQLRSAIDQIRRRLSLETVILEPGRNLLDPCIDLVANVLDVRDRRGEKWAYLDVGIYRGLLDAALIQKRFPIVAIGAPQVEQHMQQHRYMLAGPSADTLDYLGEYSFPVVLRPGDQVSVGMCGAYTWSLRTAFGGLDNVGFEVSDG